MISTNLSVRDSKVGLKVTPLGTSMLAPLLIHAIRRLAWRFGRVTVLAALFCLGIIAHPAAAGKLHEAVKSGDLAEVERLAGNGANLEAQDEAALTPLIIAVLEGRGDMVRLLIAKGADPKGRDGNGFTALHAAAHRGHLEVVRQMIEQGLDLDDQQNMSSISPLHAAAERGYVSIAELLIARGAAVDMRAGRGHTPVAMATLNTHPAMVKLLRDHGADCSYFKYPKYRDYCLSAGN